MTSRMPAEGLGVSDRAPDRRRLRPWQRTVIALGAATGVALAVREAEPAGDYREYLLYARALSSHGSPEIRDADNEWAKGFDRISREIKPQPAKYFAVGRGVTAIGGGFLKTATGTVYPLHFWMYSLFVAPIIAVLGGAGSYSYGAFALTNCLFALAAVAYIWRYWRATTFQRGLLTFLFLGSGTTFYLWWPHPEVFTASLFLVGLMALMDRRFWLTAICFGIAACQNPPVAFALGGAAALALWELRATTATFVAWIRKGGPIVGWTAIGLAIALLPAAFFKWTLGVANPIVAFGGTNAALIGPNRVFSLVFDLNIGIVTGMPGTSLLALFALVGAALIGREKGWGDSLRRMLPLLVGLIVFAAMALPATSTRNWNSGMSVYSRYGYWLSMPLIFSTVLVLGDLPRGLYRRVVTAGAILIQTFALVHYGVWGKNWRSEFLSMKPLAWRLLDRFPAAYNPVPEIFVERLRGREGISDPRSKVTVYAYPAIAHATKLLVPTRAGDTYLRLMRAQCSVGSISASQEGWVYVNGGAKTDCGLDLRADPDVLGPPAQEVPSDSGNAFKGVLSSMATGTSGGR
jgi:hypothetical protein